MPGSDDGFVMVQVDDNLEVARRRHAARRTALIIGIVALGIFVLSIVDVVMRK